MFIRKGLPSVLLVATTATVLTLTGCSAPVEQNADGTSQIAADAGYIGFSTTPKVSAPIVLSQETVPEGWTKELPAEELPTVDAGGSSKPTGGSNAGPSGSINPNGMTVEGGKVGAVGNGANVATATVLYKKDSTCQLRAGQVFVSSTEAKKGDLSATKTAFNLYAMAGTAPAENVETIKIKSDTGGEVDFYAGTITTATGKQYIAVRAVDVLMPNGVDAEAMKKATENNGAPAGVVAPDLTKGLPAALFTITCGSDAELQALDKKALIDAYRVKMTK